MPHALLAQTAPQVQTRMVIFEMEPPARQSVRGRLEAAHDKVQKMVQTLQDGLSMIAHKLR